MGDCVESLAEVKVDNIQDQTQQTPQSTVRMRKKIMAMATPIVVVAMNIRDKAA